MTVGPRNFENALNASLQKIASLRLADRGRVGGVETVAAQRPVPDDRRVQPVPQVSRIALDGGAGNARASARSANDTARRTWSN